VNIDRSSQATAFGRPLPYLAKECAILRSVKTTDAGNGNPVGAFVAHTD
jgi:hypothetical protein